MSIEVRLKFDGTETFPAGAVSRVVEYVETSFFQTESELITESRDQIQEVTSSTEELEYGFGVVDRLEAELENYRGDALVFEWASSGSLILAGAAAGIAVWLLKNTVGESIREAWINSPTHKRLVDLLSNPIIRARKTSERLDQTEISVGTGERAQLRAELKENYDGVVIEVTALIIVEKPMPIQEGVAA